MDFAMLIRLIFHRGEGGKVAIVREGRHPHGAKFRLRRVVTLAGMLELGAMFKPEPSRPKDDPRPPEVEVEEEIDPFITTPSSEGKGR